MRRTKHRAVWIAWTALLLMAPRPAGGEPDPAAFEAFETTLVNYCFDCHDSLMRKGDLDLQAALESRPLVVERDLWVNVIARLENKEMPPEDKPQPRPAEWKRMIDYLSQT